MSQVHVQLPEDVAARLHDVAASKGTTEEQVAAEAVIAYLAPRRRPSFAAMGASGHSDTSEHIEDILHAKFSR